MKVKKGFTLIELLVVIAIIALLLSILMPALVAVKFQGKVIVCKSNFHQWGLVTHMYATENNGMYPSFTVNYAGGGNAWDVAPEFIRMMMVNNELPPKTFFCPANATTEDKKAMENIETALVYLRYGHNPAPTTTFSSIHYNWWVPRLNGGTWVPTDPSKKGSYPDRDTHRSSAFMPIMSDILGMPNPNPGPTGDVTNAPDISRTDERIIGGHQRGEILRSTSVLFGDGHAETRKPQNIKARYAKGNWYNYY
jgi:prepilin-type N-terminal cleavage/methylation domain-containing protein